MIENTANIIKNIMESTGCTLQEALDNAKIAREDRDLIIEEISENQIWQIDQIYLSGFYKDDRIHLIQPATFTDENL